MKTWPRGVTRDFTILIVPARPRTPTRFLLTTHTDQELEKKQRPEEPVGAVTRREAAPRHPTGHAAL